MLSHENDHPQGKDELHPRDQAYGMSWHKQEKGGGFHGKSTLLDAIQIDVYDRIPSDGRHSVVTNPNRL